MRLVVFICARNEEPTIGEVVASTLSVAESAAETVRVLLVDDSSDDGTAAAARAAGATVVPVASGSGLANAFNIGVRAALARDASHLAHIDADNQYSASALLDLIASVHAGADLVVGDRLSSRPEGMSDIRYAWNRHLSELVSLLAGAPVRDSQSGCRVFSRQVAEAFDITSAFTYTQEQIIRTVRNGFRVEQVPIWFGPRQSNHSRLVRTPLDYLARVFHDLSSLADEYGVDLEHVRFYREPIE